MENPNFLKQKYNLHNSKEVKAATKHSNEKIPNNPEDQIQNYLNRLENVVNPPKREKHPNEDRRERNLNLLKPTLYDKFVIKPQDIPESFFENQKRIAREQGHGDIEITDEIRNQHTEVIISDQRSSLDNWINYLTSTDKQEVPYPDWLKYWSFRSVLGMGEYDKEKKQFTKRSKGTTKPFPDLDREALAYVLDAVEKKYKKEETNFDFKDEEEKKEFEKFLQGENFAKLYAWAIEKVTPASKELLANTEGEWKKYEQGSNHLPLVESLQGHGTGWCTAGESTAQAQLESGDFYVYYSYDENKKPTIPRVAIRMQEGEIAEVRGIAHEQNLDPYVNDIVKEKLAEFPDGKEYEKKTENMKQLTEIEKKTKVNQGLTKEELVFLYEIDDKIQGFGYNEDPRIKEIREQRKPNIQKDASTILECEPNQIANKPEDINENTRAYIGEIKSEIFELIQKYSIEHIYASFPEGKIQKWEMELGIRTKDGIINELKERENAKGEDRIYMVDSGKSMLEKPEFFVQEKKERAQFIKIKVGDLGFASGATVKEIYEKAESLGLELCPPETGPTIRLDYEKIFQKEQPRREWFRIAMKQIADSDGDPNVFDVDNDSEGWSWLGDHWAGPGDEWDADREIVFRLRKLDSTTERVED